MGILLLGERESRRTDYFLKAAKELNVEVDFYKYNQLSLLYDQIQNKESGSVIKADPISYEEYKLDRMNEGVENYIAMLMRLQSNLKGKARFINAPKDIAAVLDKHNCKVQLLGKGIKLTEMLAYNIKSIEELKELIREKRINKVFIKPVYGSGSAAVLAYQFNHQKNKQVLYTSCNRIENVLMNTKKLFKIEEPELIMEIISRVLKMKTIVERWYTKSEYNGMKYDLRVVYQYGKIDFIVARQSKGPITNLHLNNKALNMNEIGLSEDTLEDIRQMCEKAMNQFSGLNYAGIDILIEKNTNTPYIIEINGQGDLMYTDIFNKNSIYKNQILHEKSLIDKEKILKFL